MTPYFLDPYRAGSGGSGGLASWSHYTEITIPSSSVSSDLTSFPVYVNLAHLPAGFFSTVRSDGLDIRVYDTTGSTQYAREVTAISTGSSTGELHFLAPTLSSSTNNVFRVYYGNASATSPGSPYNAADVWTSYELVLHSGKITDSSNHHTPSESGAPVTTTASAKMGAATSYNGSGDYVSVPDATGLDFGSSTDFTFSAWVKTTATSTSEIIVKPNAGVGAPLARLVMQSNAGTYAARAVLNDGTNSASAHGTTAINTGSWVLLHAVFDRDGNVVMYRNATSDATASATSVGSVDNATALYLAGWPDSGTPNYLSGSLDEVRVQRRALSTAWVSAEYSNQNAPASFYSVGTHTANT